MTTSVVKITKKERFESIKALCGVVGDIDGFDLDGIVEFCDKEIEALSTRAAKAKERAAAKRAEGDELQAVVYAALTDEPATREEVTEKIDGDDVSVAKVGYRLTSLVAAGKAVKEEVTIEGEDGKTKKKAAYRLA